MLMPSSLYTSLTTRRTTSRTWGGGATHSAAIKRRNATLDIIRSALDAVRECSETLDIGDGVNFL
jgi:hypothetical protein